MTEAQTQALASWQHLRRRTYRSWLLNIGLAILGSFWLVTSYRHADPTFLVILLIIPVLALRGAWRDDKSIRNCDVHIARVASEHAADPPQPITSRRFPTPGNDPA